MSWSAEDDAGRRTVYWPDMERIPAARALWRPVDGDAPGGAAERRARAVRAAIDAVLTARQREAVELYFFEGLSQAQIAARLGVSQQVIHRRIHGATRRGRRVGGALARLRTALAPALNEPPSHP